MRWRGDGILALMVALLWASPPAAAAAPRASSWRWDTGGPGGGAIRDVVVDPTDGDHLWAVTAGAGIFVSEDQGSTWRPSRRGIENPWGACWVTSLAVSPSGQRLLAGTRRSGLFVSEDGGTSWSPTDAAFGLNVETLQAIRIDPRDASHLLVGANDGLYSSADGGRSFQKVDLPTAGDFPAHVLAIEFHPADSRRIFVSVDPGGLFASGDGGATWSHADDGLLSPPACLAIDPATPGRLWAGGADGLFRWDGAAARWSPCGTGVPRGVEITSLLLLGGRNGGLFAGSRLGALFVSRDGGERWDRLSDAPPQPGPVRLVPGPDGDLYFTGGGGLFLSADGGRSWLTLDESIPVAGLRDVECPGDAFGHLLAATAVGLFESRDFGDHWTRINVGLKGAQFSVNQVAADRRNPNRLAAATDGGLLLSDDGGQTWRNAPLSGLVTSVVFPPRNGSPSDLLLATVLEGDETVVYRSTDGGAGWSAMTRSPLDPAAWLYSDATGGALFFITSRLFKSADQGLTWREVTNAPPALHVTALGESRFESDRLLAGTDMGLFASSDNGDTWTPAGFDARRILALETHPYDPMWLAVLTEDGLKVSRDGAKSWSAVPLDGVPGRPMGISVDPSGDVLYLLDGNSVYAARIPSRERSPEVERVHGFPNPFQSAARLKFDLAQPGTAEAFLYTVHGELVRRLELGSQPAGPGSVDWDGFNEAGEKVPNGIYIVVIRTESEQLRGKLICTR